jgi:DNA polymerase III subunit epsilon
MRQIILDTETTGLEHAQGHRLIEIGAVELVNRRATGRTFHYYLDPERDVDEDAAKVHGIRRAQLVGKPKFAQVAQELVDFISGAELLAHNASFDVAFLDMELGRLGEKRRIAAIASKVTDTLVLARQMHPGQANNLDALCKRYHIDNSRRDLHGALLDARILADVYLAMTGGQEALALAASASASRAAGAASQAKVRPAGPLVVVMATGEELQAHEAMLKVIGKASGGKCLWQANSASAAAAPTEIAKAATG